MSHPIRLAIQIHPQHAPYSALRDAAIEAEERGADIVMNWDHFYPLSGDPDGLHFECWTNLASFAEVTKRVEIGPLVICNSYRNPNLLADMARTVDHISAGRFILGIGSGWFEKDYENYGYEFGTAPGRLKALRRDLPIIKHRLEVLNPPPLRKMPIMIGGGGEKVTLRITAEHADIWHGFGDADRIRHKCEVLDAHCAAIGRNPAEIERSAGVPKPERGNPAYGDAMVDAGATLLTFGLSAPDLDQGFLDKWVEWRDERNQGRGARS